MTSPPAPASGIELWSWLCALTGARRAGVTSDASVLSVVAASGGVQVCPGVHPEAALIASGSELRAQRALDSEAAQLLEQYAPLCTPANSRLVVAHLGQSLDGRIGPPSGMPEAITGPEDVRHNHRMRALFDVVLVGAGTVCHDNPQLTVRHVEGPNPVRVVLDPDRRLSDKYALFHDDLAPTLLLCRADQARAGERHGQAEVVGVPGSCSPAAVLEALERRSLRRIFIEGGGVTVSRFLAARCLDRLQLAVSPLIMGQGRPGIDLGETLRLRPQVRRFQLADDILFECCFR
jgi:riboflavin-specific deaminase-like protein